MTLTNNNNFRRGTQVTLAKEAFDRLMAEARDRGVYDTRREAEEDGYRDIIEELIND